MAINSVQIPAIKSGHTNLLNTDFDRIGDKGLYLGGMMPCELHKFIGDGELTVKTVQTGLNRVLGGMVMNVTDGVDWSNTILVKTNPNNPTQADVSVIPADTDVYVLLVFGDKNSVESVGAI